MEFTNSFLVEIIGCIGPLIDNPQILSKLEDIKLKIYSSSTELKLSYESITVIDESRDVFKSVSKRGALFYMSLYRLKIIDSLYQFSIDSFVKLFLNSIKTAKRDEVTSDRNINMIDKFMNDVFEFSCICIYEKDNLLFLFQIACALDKDVGKLLDSELIFFIKGGASVENDVVKNPTPWLTNKCWQDVVGLSTTFNHFSGLIESVCNNTEVWRQVNYVLIRIVHTSYTKCPRFINTDLYLPG